MLIAREFVAYLARQLVRKLSGSMMETVEPQVVSELIATVITGELEI